MVVIEIFYKTAPSSGTPFFFTCCSHNSCFIEYTSNTFATWLFAHKEYRETKKSKSTYITKPEWTRVKKIFRIKRKLNKIMKIEKNLVIQTLLKTLCLSVSFINAR